MKMKKEGFLDLVIGGPDMSGTSTQIKDVLFYFVNNNYNVKDLRGTELDIIAHSEIFKEKLAKGYPEYRNLEGYLLQLEKYKNSGVSAGSEERIFFLINELFSGGGTNQDLRIASMVKNNVTSYINPNSGEVFIMEEPSKRGAGQVARVIEQNRSKFGGQLNPYAAALVHQAYRSEEFLRFRGPLRQNNKKIVRSRSEESACYQIYDKQFLKKGITQEEYLKLPGHQIAFANAPTNVFVVCGPKDWTIDDYLELKRQRSSGRDIDDHEADANYQVLVNHRYATDWLENLYHKGCKMYGGTMPEITRFNLYDSREEIKKKMQSKLETLL